MAIIASDPATCIIIALLSAKLVWILHSTTFGWIPFHDCLLSTQCVGVFRRVFFDLAPAWEVRESNSSVQVVKYWDYVRRSTFPPIGFDQTFVSVCTKSITTPRGPFLTVRMVLNVLVLLLWACLRNGIELFKATALLSTS